MAETFCFNIQVGLAVGDIESVQRTATLQRMAMQVSFVAEVENKYPRFITRKIYKPLLELKPNAYKSKLGLVLLFLFLFPSF